MVGMSKKGWNSGKHPSFVPRGCQANVTVGRLNWPAATGFARCSVGDAPQVAWLGPSPPVIGLRWPARTRLTPNATLGIHTAAETPCPERSAECLTFAWRSGIESEQPLKWRSRMQISQRIGGAANPSSRADGNRKQRGSAAHLPRRWPALRNVS